MKRILLGTLVLVSSVAFADTNKVGNGTDFAHFVATCDENGYEGGQQREPQQIYVTCSQEVQTWEAGAGAPVPTPETKIVRASLTSDKSDVAQKEFRSDAARVSNGSCFIQVAVGYPEKSFKSSCRELKQYVQYGDSGLGVFCSLKMEGVSAVSKAATGATQGACNPNQNLPGQGPGQTPGQTPGQRR